MRVNLEPMKSHAAYRMIQQFRPWLAGCMHDLAGFPKRDFSDIASLSTHHMPSHIPLDEILATDGFTIILENIYENSLKKKKAPYGVIFKRAIQKRFETGFDKEDWEPPKDCEKKSVADDLRNGFTEICSTEKLGKYALPIAFAWANAELARCEMKPFIINENMLKNAQESSRKNPGAYLCKAINDCRDSEKTEESGKQSPTSAPAI